MFVVLSWR